MAPKPRSTAERFGRYRLLEQIGEGGMAVIHRAVLEGPVGFSRNVVLKRPLPALASDDAFVRMFVSEARLSALLHHPGIVQVHEFDQVDGEYYLAMEEVDGVDLAALLRTAHERSILMPIGVASYLVGEVAAALAYAHALTDPDGNPLGIIHRDVSPSNVMIARSGAVKLLDFGIAKALHAISDERTRTGSIMGKMGYISPEQADGRALDRRADLFSLGIIMYECLTGRRLFRGIDDFETLRLVREAEVPWPSFSRPEVPAALDRVTMRLLARDLDDRYARGEDVVADLVPITRDLRCDESDLQRFAMATAPPRAEPIAVTALTPSVDQLDTVPHPGPGRTRRRILAAGAVVALVAVGGALAWQLGRGTSDEVGGIPIVTPPEAPAEIQPVAVAPEPADASSAPVDAAAREAPVHLRVDGTRGAEIVIDRKVVGRVPLDLDLPRGAGTRKLVVRRAGHVTQTYKLASDRDAYLRIDLARKRGRTNKAHEPDPVDAEIKDPFVQ